MRHLVAQEGLGERIDIDSAGTGDWHVGRRRRDRRSAGGGRGARDSAVGRGAPVHRRPTSRASITCSRWTARTATICCAWRRDAADARQGARCCARSTRARRPTPRCPTRTTAAPRGFEEVFDICERACRGLLDHLRRAHGAMRDGAMDARLEASLATALGRASWARARSRAATSTRRSRSGWPTGASVFVKTQRRARPTTCSSPRRAGSPGWREAKALRVPGVLAASGATS